MSICCIRRRQITNPTPWLDVNSPLAQVPSKPTDTGRLHWWDWLLSLWKISFSSHQFFSSSSLIRTRFCLYSSSSWAAQEVGVTGGGTFSASHIAVMPSLPSLTSFAAKTNLLLTSFPCMVRGTLSLTLGLPVLKNCDSSQVSHST